MDIKNVKAKDLMSGNLTRLLQEIEDQIKAGNYQDLEKCLNELAKIGSNIEIKTNDDGSKTAVVKAKDGNTTEDIDFMAVAKQLKEKMKMGVPVKGNQKQLRKSYLDKVNSTLGTLLRENEITEELVARGISYDVIRANGESEIKRSEQKVGKLEKALEKAQNVKELFGEDSYIESAKKWDSKSDITKVKDGNLANAKLEKIKQNLADMYNLADTTGLSNQDQKANYESIDKFWNEITTLKKEIEDLQISGLDLSDLNSIAKYNPNDISSKEAKILLKIGDLSTSKNEILKDINDTITDNEKELSDYLPSNAQLGSLSEKEIMQMAGNIDKKIKMYNREIRYEQEYQDRTKESMDNFKEALQHEDELNKKFEWKPVQVPVQKKKVKQRQKIANGQPAVDANGQPIMEDETDANGNPVYETDANGQPIMEDEKDADGNVIYQDDPNGTLERVATATTVEEARKRIGLDADKEQDYIDTAKSNAEKDAETAIANMTTEAKRDMIRKEYRKDGKWHPIKFLRSQFAPNSMWNALYRDNYISGKVQKAEDDARIEIDNKIDDAVTSEGIELMKKARLANKTRRYVVEELGMAVSRERVLYNVENGMDKDEIKDKAVRGAVMAGLSKGQKYAEFSSDPSFASLTDDEKRAMEKAEFAKLNKEASYARAYSDDVRNPQQYNKNHKKTFTDRDER